MGIQYFVSSLLLAGNSILIGCSTLGAASFNLCLQIRGQLVENSACCSLAVLHVYSSNLSVAIEWD